MSEELSVYIENSYDAFSLLASAFLHRHMVLGQQTTPHLSSSTADLKVTIRSCRILVSCVKFKENSCLVYSTFKITYESDCCYFPFPAPLFFGSV